MAISRRRLLAAGGYALAGTSALLHTTSVLAQEDKGSAATPFTLHAPQSANAVTAAQNGSSLTKEQIIRTYYSGWEKKEWSLIDSVLADSFTFTSPNDDDHIGKDAFKARCWPQAEFIEHFELESVLGRDNEAFVKGLCRTTKGSSFRNIEYFRFAGGRVNSIEVYFGGHLGFPTASISGKP